MAYLRNIQLVIGIIAWWITCREVSWLFFLRRTKKKESMKSVNLEKKNHQTMLAAVRPSSESE